MSPISLKDLFDVRGLATTAASNVRRTDVARGAAVPGLVAGYGESHARETGRRHRVTGLPIA